MFCPECKAEYREGFTRCSECDAELVQRLPKPEPVQHPEPSEYLVISTVQDLIQQDQIRAFLEANGISTSIRREAVGRAYGLTLNGLGGCDILVPRESATAARDLLDRADRGELKIEEESES